VVGILELGRIWVDWTEVRSIGVIGIFRRGQGQGRESCVCRRRRVVPLLLLQLASLLIPQTLPHSEE
jgi:hypothetical protein